jgi:predicted nucleotidyltransferase
MDARDDVLSCFVFPGAAMSSTRLDDPILTRFRQALGDVYGSKLERVVLFGSRARGDARPDSDYDVAVFIHQPEGFGEESGRLAVIETDILFDTGAVINALPFHAGAYRKRTGLMSELRRDGIDL